MEKMTLANARKSLNLTQSELAKQLNIARQTISRIENNRSLPSKVSKKITAFFNKHNKIVTFDLTVSR